jgi:TRAP-type C4-dicarboxylate transport system permease large subunit
MAPIVVILIFMGIILILGCILDSASILLLTMPIMFPVIMAYGIDPIWFGIVAIVTVEIGLLTPPFGMVVFAMKASLPRDVGLGEIFSGALSFLWVLLATLGILIAFPELTLWLPNMLFNG